MASINDHGGDTAVRLTHEQMVNEAPVAGTERDADEVAELALAGLGVEFADRSEGFALDDGERVRPG